jgi:hypothetical protein
MTTIAVTYPDTIGVELAKRCGMLDDPIKNGSLASFDDDEDDDLDDDDDDDDLLDDDGDDEEEGHDYLEDDDDEGEEWKRGRQSEDE